MTEIGAPEPVHSVNAAFLRSVARMLGYDLSDPATMITEIHIYSDVIAVEYIDTTQMNPVHMRINILVRRSPRY